MPSVFVWPSIAAYTDPPWPKALIYPARGIAALWEPGAGAPPDALAALLGRSRARLLVALAEPASTTQLATVLGLAPGAVGDHLRCCATRACQRARSGRSVLYRAPHWVTRWPAARGSSAERAVPASLSRAADRSRSMP